MIKTNPKSKRRYIPDYTKAAPPARGIEYFYAMLVQGGILLRLDGNNIVIDAPNNNVSPVLREAVEKRNAALVAHLKGLPR
jgi:hypothetical protein